MHHRDEDEGYLDPREFPDPDSDDNGHAETVPCPHCRRPVYEEAQCCPYCENYLSGEDAPGRRSAWFVVGVLVCLAVALTWALWG